MKFEDHFQDMIDQVFPKLEATSKQYQDLRRAFYGGAFVVINNPYLATEVALESVRFATPGSYDNDTRKPQ